MSSSRQTYFSALTRSLTLDEAAFELFAELNRKIKQVELAVKALKAARRKGKKPTQKMQRRIPGMNNELFVVRLGFQSVCTKKQ
jgi:hypothetical protein